MDIYSNERFKSVVRSNHDGFYAFCMITVYTVASMHTLACMAHYELKTLQKHHFF